MSDDVEKLFEKFKLMPIHEQLEVAFSVLDEKPGLGRSMIRYVKAELELILEQREATDD